MAEAVIILFHNDGRVDIGLTGEVACLHMTKLQPSLWCPTDAAILEKIGEELSKVKRKKR
ncbi:MAG: hypothetical protein NT093_03880 [Candidatus Moranbacteria bacterium]|nr:hypothetical protein [Candidatus Moranbacteria bacterium]